MNKLVLGMFLLLFSFSTVGQMVEASPKASKGCKINCKPECQSADCGLTFTIQFDPLQLLIGSVVEFSLTTPNGEVTTIPVTTTTPSPIKFSIAKPACCGIYTITLYNVNAPNLNLPNFMVIPSITNSCSCKVLDGTCSLFEIPFLFPGSAIQIPINITSPFLSCKHSKCEKK